MLHACIVVNIVWADDADDHADVYHDDGLLQGVDAAWKWLHENGCREWLQHGNSCKEWLLHGSGCRDGRQNAKGIISLLGRFL